MESLTIDGLSSAELTELNYLLARLRKRQRRNRIRSAYYDGRRAVGHVGGVIPAQYENLAITLGWAAKGVDGLARRVNLDGFVLPGVDIVDDWEALDESNLLMAELAQARTDAFIHGVSFLTVTRGLEGEPAALVHAADALSSTGRQNPRTRRLDSFLSVHEWDKDQPQKLELFLPDVIISAERVRGKWETSRSGHSWGVPVEALTYRPRVSRRAGKSRITRPLMGYQDAAVRALLRMEAHMDIYAIPQMLFLGADEGIFKNADGSLKSNMQVMMGRVLGIPDDDDAVNPRVDVQQFAAQSPQPHLEQLNALAKLSAREADLPDADFALTDVSNPTSEGSYAASRENLIAEAEGAQEDFSVPLRRTVAMALSIQAGLGSVPAEFTRIKPQWRSPIYLSKAQQADAGLKIMQADPSIRGTRVGYELLGLTPLQIEQVQEDQALQTGRSVLQMVASDGADNI